jgi:hypothetical protein
MVSPISSLLRFLPSNIHIDVAPDVSTSTADDAFVKPVDKPQDEPKQGIANTILEYGRKFLENPKWLGTGINILPGVAVGLRVEGSLHTKKSPLVENNPFRLASTTVLEKDNPRHSIIWTQTGGILELGLGLNGTLPLCQFVGLQGGFIPSTLLRYRCIKPHVLGFFETQNSLLNKNNTSLPFSSQSAKNLAAGSEYELIGQGGLRVLGGVVANAGTPVNSWLNAGIGASGFVNVSGTQAVAVNVLALDGANRVRVTLNQMNEDAKQAGLMAYAGITGQIGPQFPSIGEGLLTGGPTLLAAPMADLLNVYYTSLSVQASTLERSRDTTIATFDIDLSKPKACEAFDALMRLSTVEAEELSSQKNSGVRQLKQVAKEDESRDEFSANFLGDKLFLYQALTNEKKGHFTTPDGETMIFRQAHFKEHESGWFDPTRDVLWESVSLKNAKDNSSKTFFRFRFQKEGDLPAQEFEDYFGLADALALKGREAQKHEHDAGKGDDICKRALMASSKVLQSTDLYFTPQGIRNMQSVTKEQARQAYMQAVGNIREAHDLTFLKADPSKERELVTLLNKYDAEVNAGWFGNFGHSKRLSDCALSYKTLTGREIEADAVTYSNATIFANRLAQLKTATDPRALEAFFVGLGKSKGFRYKCVIGALAKISGDQETLVHQHEMGGNGVVFKYTDGGKLEGPSEIVTALLSKAL